jgi:hypothetical protein
MEDFCTKEGLSHSYGFRAIVFTMMILGLNLGLTPEKYRELLQSMLNDFSRNYRVPEDGMD